MDTYKSPFIFSVAHFCCPNILSSISMSFYQGWGPPTSLILPYCSNPFQKIGIVFKCYLYHELGSIIIPILDMEMMTFQEATLLVHHYTVFWAWDSKRSHIIDAQARLSSIRPYN